MYYCTLMKIVVTYIILILTILAEEYSTFKKVCTKSRVLSLLMVAISFCLDLKHLCLLTSLSLSLPLSLYLSLSLSLPLLYCSDFIIGPICWSWSFSVALNRMGVPIKSGQCEPIKKNLHRMRNEKKNTFLEIERTVFKDHTFFSLRSNFSFAILLPTLYNFMT